MEKQTLEFLQVLAAVGDVHESAAQYGGGNHIAVEIGAATLSGGWYSITESGRRIVGAAAVLGQFGEDVAEARADLERY